MAKALLLSKSYEWLAAFFTWLLVACTSLYFMYQSDRFSLPDTGFAALLYLTFFILWACAVRDKPYQHEPNTRFMFLLLQVIVVCTLYFIVPFTYNAILMVLASSILPHLTTLHRSLFISLLLSTPLWLIYQWYWQQDGMLITAALFWTFNLFAIVIINAMLNATRTQEALGHKNRELLATQSLLTEATKQSERTRIARDIHDLLGHHLTAMTIKLQVASRLSEGEAKQQIDECYGLAKLLLSDVREAVSEIREKSALDIRDAITTMQHSTPELKVHSHIDSDVQIDDVNQAEVIIRTIQETITNTLKHAGARRIDINLTSDGRNIMLSIIDDGASSHKRSDAIHEGNGLTGIRERAAQIGADVMFEQTDKGFKTVLTWGGDSAIQRSAS
ncbi:sensor histidine kinase [Alteromonas facilis]|uniref:sensor histidine kinase n=1 Tax=Alteromonas facilis TaxID=2048004 RepID=UPI000C28EDC6|nr:histidine kinase [Alteromonas facilis]